MRRLALALHEVKRAQELDEAWHAASRATTLAPEEGETHFVIVRVRHRIRRFLGTALPAPGLRPGVRVGVGLLLVAVWTALGIRTVRRLPVPARRYLATLPRRQLGFGIMAVGVSGCVAGSLVAAFAPFPVAGVAWTAALVAILVSFVTSWVMVVRNRRRRSTRRAGRRSCAR